MYFHVILSYHVKFIDGIFLINPAPHIVFEQILRFSQLQLCRLYLQ